MTSEKDGAKPSDTADTTDATGAIDTSDNATDASDMTKDTAAEATAAPSGQADEAPKSDRPEPTPASIPETPVSPSRKGTGMVPLVLSVLALALSTAVATRDYWGASLPTDMRDSLPAVLTPRATPPDLGQIDNLEDEIDDLWQRVREHPQALARLENDINARMRELQSRSLQSQTQPQQDNTELQQRLTDLEARVQQLPERDPDLINERLNSLREQQRQELNNLRESLRQDLADLKQDLTAVTDLAARIPDQDVRLDAQARQIEEIRLAMSSREMLSRSIDDMRVGISNAQTGIDELETKFDQQLDTLRRTTNANISTLFAAIGRTQKATLSDEALILALGQLRNRLDVGKGYEREMALVRDMFTDNSQMAAAIAALDAHEDSGIATLEELKGQFNDIAADLVRGAAAGDDQNWIDEAAYRLSSLVSIRPVGMQKGDNTAALVANAEARLAENDLEGAVEHVSKLTHRPAEIAAPWLEQAQARLAADAAMQDLTATALRRVRGNAATANANAEGAR